MKKKLILLAFFSQVSWAEKPNLTEYEQGVISGYLQTRTVAVRCASLNETKQEIIDCLMKNKGKIDIKKATSSQ